MERETRQTIDSGTGPPAGAGPGGGTAGEEEMPSYVIHFERIGSRRGPVTVAFTGTDLTLMSAAIYQAVTPHLLSRDVLVTVDLVRMDAVVIVGGIRPIAYGRIKVVSPAPVGRDAEYGPTLPGENRAS